jgi:ubiquinone/menaquinone biosynthesis C-methylase UbiE
MAKYSEVPVNLQRKELYGSSFFKESFGQRADDIRRKLIIDYSVPPEDRVPGYEKRDVWKEEARDIIELTGGGPDVRVLDAGMSGGYLIRKLLEHSGFSGQVTGVDIEAAHVDELQKELRQEFPDAKFELGQADAEKLNFAVIGDTRHRIPDDYFDVTIENYIHHHTHDPEAAIRAALRVTKAGGHSIFAARHIGHLDNVYFAAGTAAQNLGLKIPEPYYHKYDFDQMKLYLTELEEQGVCRLVKEVPHVNHLWIDGNEEGWSDFSNAVMALLPDMNRQGAQKKTIQELSDFLNDLYFPGYVSGSIKYYNGYIMDVVAQKYFIVQKL